ncbi:unnamed protein product [Timema podura]|uniref:Uncharacterized protein n=1 Tax=Timema podura TaxID=61482 RepID=A0ABN7NTU0_TIMPD|nr:unnamed protein product [Timema podura]
MKIWLHVELFQKHFSKNLNTSGRATSSVTRGYCLLEFVRHGQSLPKNSSGLKCTKVSLMQEEKKTTTCAQLILVTSERMHCSSTNAEKEVTGKGEQCKS